MAESAQSRKRGSDASVETSIRTTKTWRAGRLISLSGEIGPWDALLLDEQLLDAAEEGVITIAVDLSRVSGVDRAAVRILLEAAERQRAVGGELFLATRDSSSRLGYRIRPFSPGEALLSARDVPPTE